MQYYYFKYIFFLFSIKIKKPKNTIRKKKKIRACVLLKNN